MPSQRTINYFLGSTLEDPVLGLKSVLPRSSITLFHLSNKKLAGKIANESSFTLSRESVKLRSKLLAIVCPKLKP